MNLPTSFLYGSAAYRPTNPPREEFRKHLTIIKKELKFDIIRLRVQWNHINREPDQYDFGELDELIELCEELGLTAFMEVSLQSAPYWLEEDHPETRYVNVFGQAAELGANESIQVGGYPGLCHHHQPVVDAGARFLTAVADNFKVSKAVLGYDCWNEAHLEPAWISSWGNLGERLYCYCVASRQAFRDWLKERYSTIERLNDTWGRAYRHFGDVNPPIRHGNYADWLDWGRFWHDDLRHHMAWRYGALRASDPDHLIMSHSGAVPPFLPRANAYIHNWKLAEPVDLWGTSLAPHGFNWELADIAGVLDATHSASRGKPWWVNELPGGGGMFGKSAEDGASYAFRRCPVPTVNQYRTWNWLSVVCGSKATIHWCYLEERHGPESGGFGLVRANGEVTPRARGAAETAEILRRHSPVFFDYQPKPQVGILFDPDNCDLLFAMERGDQLYGDAHIGINRAVWRSDNSARYVTYCSMEDLEGLKVLIVPLCLTLPEEVGKAIAKFVEAGGVLVAEARTGQYDHRGFNRPTLPGAGLHEVVGAIEGESICSDPNLYSQFNNPDRLPYPDPLLQGPAIDVTDPIAIKMGTHEYFVPLRPSSGQPIAQSMDHCLAVRNTYGKGVAYYLGTYLSLGIYRGDQEGMQWLLSVLDRHTSPQIRGKDLRPRLIENGDEALLAVFNDSRTESCREKIDLPNPYTSAREVHTDQDHPVTGQQVEVDVAAHGVQVLRMGRGG